MGMGFAPTWLRQVSPLLHKTNLTTGYINPGIPGSGLIPGLEQVHSDTVLCIQQLCY